MEAKVRALEDQLEARAGELAVLISQGDTDSADYFSILREIDRLSRALSEARKEQSKLETMGVIENFNQRLAYLEANAQVEQLRNRLDRLTQSLALEEIGEVDTSIEFLNMTEPTIPVEVPPERVRGRNAVMMGGIFGIGLAWVVLNRRWIAQSMRSGFATSQPEEEEEEV